MRRKTMIVTARVRALYAAVVIGGAVVGGYVALDAAANKPSGLAPENLAALLSEKTRLSNVPPITRVIGDPKPGQVHKLGYGILAWESSGDVCFVGQGAAGCVGRLPKPISASIGDADAAGLGSPAYVHGLATDDVVAVTVTAKDGRTASGRVFDNFFYVTLPPDLSIFDVVNVQAGLEDGSSYEENVESTAGPPRLR